MTWHDHKVVIRPFQSLSLRGCELTAAGVAALVPAMRRPWASLDNEYEPPTLNLSDNPLGDAGVQMVAELLPHTVGTEVGFVGVGILDVSGTSCGDDRRWSCGRSRSRSSPYVHHLQTIDRRRNGPP